VTSQSRHTAAALLLLAMSSISACVADDDTADMLVRNASLVHPATGEIEINRCVWINGKRIDRISSCNPSDTAGHVIDADGKWIIPGLWDMHVHAVWDIAVYPDLFADFVEYGVVGIRDMGGTREALADARRFLADDRNIGPELIAAGQVIDGAQPLQPMIAVSAANYEEGVQAVAELDDLGVDFIKIYTMLSPEAMAGVFEEARARGLDVAGHLPAEVTVSDALRLGMASIEHMAVGIGGLCDVTNEALCIETFKELTDAGIHLTPTLLIRHRPGTMRDEQTIERSRIAEMPPILAADWQASLDRNLNERSDSYFAEKSAQFEQERRLTEIAIESNALILVGTDTGDFLVPPGSSIHEELELLVDAGMEEKDALFAASGRATDFLGLEDRGRIQEGAIADLIILDGNPLDDIRNTQKISAVVFRGRLLDADQP
jgi:imidazolonepropionase-like amidohydrolase